VREAGGQPVQTANASAAQFLDWAEVNLARTSHQPVSKIV